MLRLHDRPTVMCMIKIQQMSRHSRSHLSCSMHSLPHQGTVVLMKPWLRPKYFSRFFLRRTSGNPIQKHFLGSFFVLPVSPSICFKSSFEKFVNTWTRQPSRRGHVEDA